MHLCENLHQLVQILFQIYCGFSPHGLQCTNRQKGNQLNTPQVPDRTDRYMYQKTKVVQRLCDKNVLYCNTTLEITTTYDRHLYMFWIFNVLIQ